MVLFQTVRVSSLRAAAAAAARLSTTTRRGGPRTRSGGSGSAVEKTADVSSDDERSARVRSRLSNGTNDLPSLKEFVNKTTVVRQYRDFLRAVSTIPDETFRTSSADEVRWTFRRHSYMTDRVAIEMEVTEGGRRLEQVRRMVGHVDPSRKEDDPDSWLNIDDEDDPRGRVGVQWPWEQSK